MKFLKNNSSFINLVNIKHERGNQKMTTTAYLRISTDSQEIEAQKTEIMDYAENRSINIDRFVEIEISSRKNEKARGITELQKSLKRNDVLIVSELSRLARSIREIHNVIDTLLDKGVTIHLIKQGFVAKQNDLTTKVFINAFGMAAEIERDLISQRTKNGLALAKARGKQLGNPNLKVDNTKRIEKADDFAESLRPILTGLINQGLTQRQISDELNKTGIKTPRGKEWQLLSLQNAMKRLGIKTLKARG